MHFNWSQNLFGMDGQAYPPLHPWMCGLLSAGEGKVGTPFRKLVKRMIFGGQQTACTTTPCPNLCFLGIPQTSFSIKFKRELCDIYPDCTKQIDSMLKKTNKQTDVHGRTEWHGKVPHLSTLYFVWWFGWDVGLLTYSVLSICESNLYPPCRSYTYS